MCNVIPIFFKFDVSAEVLLSHQSEGKTHQQALLEVCGSGPGDLLLCGEGETERSCLLLLLCGPALYCSYGGPHRPLVSVISNLTLFHSVVMFHLCPTLAETPTQKAKETNLSSHSLDTNYKLAKVSLSFNYLLCTVRDITLLGS